MRAEESRRREYPLSQVTRRSPLLAISLTVERMAL